MKNDCPFTATNIMSKKAMKFFHCWLQDNIILLSNAARYYKFDISLPV